MKLGAKRTTTDLRVEQLSGTEAKRRLTEFCDSVGPAVNQLLKNDRATQEKVTRLEAQSAAVLVKLEQYDINTDTVWKRLRWIVKGIV